MNHEKFVESLRKLIRTGKKRSLELIKTKYDIGVLILRQKEEEKIGYGKTEAFMSSLSDEIEYSKRELYSCIEFVMRFRDWDSVEDRILHDRAKLEVSWYEIKETILPSMRSEEHKAELAALSKKVTLPPNIRTACGDYRVELPKLLEPKSVDVFITEPPYPNIEDYHDLGVAAKTFLKEGGYLCTYTGALYENKVYAALDESLEYHMRINVRSPTGLANPRFRDFWLTSKDILVYSNGVGRKHEWMMDVIDGEKGDKGAHEWAQSEYEAAYLVEHLTEPNHLVVDPMAGSFTTVRVAQYLKRQAVGIEIDEGRYKVGLGTFQTVENVR